ncbi:hypothetical protein IMZ48_21200 [Candidatus Bathyarchaeota archaeon]|nr:hypothetical protein [Candidatus Bathyarchaeota archaeon]
MASPRTRRKDEVAPRSSPTSPAKDTRAREKGQLETERRDASKDIRIITLDSLGGPHSKTCQMLRRYLVEEAKTRKDLDAQKLNKKLGLTAKNIPGQENFCDCGVFLLGYAQRFLEDPDGFVATILQKGKPEWTVDAPNLRNEIRDTLFRLHKEYREEELAKRKAKKQKKVKGRTTESLSTGPETPVSEAQDRAASALDQRDDPPNKILAGGGDPPLSTPANEQESSDCSVEPGPVNQQAEGRTTPRQRPQPAAPMEKSKTPASSQREAPSQNGSGTPSALQDARRWEEAKIRKSIELDGGRSPRSPHHTDSSPNSSPTQGQPDQEDCMVHSSSAPSPSGVSTNKVPNSPPASVKQSIEKPACDLGSEPKLIRKLSLTPTPARSVGSPILGEGSPRKRDAKVMENEGDDETPRAPKRAKETETTSAYFKPGDRREYSYKSRNVHDPRGFGPKKESGRGGDREGGQGRRSSDPVNLIDSD